MNIEIYNPLNLITVIESDAVRNFLHKHLDQYGDPPSAIQKALDYASKSGAGLGGTIVVAKDSEDVIGAVILNKTGMEEYIPENILVYIAIHKDFRGRGIGRKLMEATISECKGDIALHVEPDNPAKFLYEKLGFTNPYLEMRLKR